MKIFIYKPVWSLKIMDETGFKDKIDRKKMILVKI